MRRGLYVGLLCSLLVVPVAGQAPTLDAQAKSVIADQVKLDAANARAEAIALDALKRTDEYKVYESAQKARQASQMDIRKRVIEVAPGFTLNFQTYQLEPVKP